MKNIIKLTEEDLRRIIQESIDKLINEIGDTPKGQYLLGRLNAWKTPKRYDYDDSEIAQYAQQPRQAVQGTNYADDLYNAFEHGQKDTWGLPRSQQQDKASQMGTNPRKAMKYYTPAPPMDAYPDPWDDDYDEKVKELDKYRNQGHTESQWKRYKRTMQPKAQKGMKPWNGNLK